MTNIELERISAKGRMLGMEMVYRAASGHIGGSLSAMDILTELYFEQLSIDPERADCPGRDRFVMSKGHCTPALYPILALRGYFPEKDLELFRSIEGHMSGHPDMRHVKGVDMSTGSLGQGISAAVGMALAAKVDRDDFRVWALLGDGECEEGQVWEAFAAASKYGLSNLCVTIDINGLQIDGKTADVMPMEPFDEKLRAFGFEVFYADGHDFDSLRAAYVAAGKSAKPSAVLAKTVKGKGVSFMENDAGWHGKAPNAEQYELAMGELRAAYAALGGK
ncbi:MAG: transketolase [Oscillospiraceae bacterium]